MPGRLALWFPDDVAHILAAAVASTVTLQEQGAPAMLIAGRVSVLREMAAAFGLSLPVLPPAPLVVEGWRVR